MEKMRERAAAEAAAKAKRVEAEPRAVAYAKKVVIGTLCLIDVRPRTLEGPDLERLHDLADIALRETLATPLSK